MLLLAQATVDAVGLVTDANATSAASTPAGVPGVATWAATVAIIMTIVTILALAYGWWRMRTGPLDRALAGLCLRYRLARRSDRDALRTLAQCTGAPHAVALLLSPSTLGGALAAYGAQIGEARVARLRRRVLEAA